MRDTEPGVASSERVTPHFVIKICGITSLEDAQHALSSGANALGFNFYLQSPRFVTQEQARDIVEALPGNYLRVGVFVNAQEEELLQTGSRVPLDVLQLHGEACPVPHNGKFRVWRSVAGDNPPTLCDPQVEAYLLDTPTPEFGGSGRVFSWARAAGFRGRIVVAGGLQADNVAQAIETLHPWGVDACSRLESAPGKKDRDQVRIFIEAAVRAHAAASETVVSL